MIGIYERGVASVAYRQGEGALLLRDVGPNLRWRGIKIRDG